MEQGELAEMPVVIDRATRQPKLDFAASDTLYATHALHAFAAKCPPPLARWAIEAFTRPGDTIVDPMVGSGTTLVEAVLLGRSAIGTDIDPLARLIAKVKSTPIDLAVLDEATDALLERFERGPVEPIDGPSEVPVVHRLERWFDPTVVNDLVRLKRCIRAADVHSDVRDFFYLAFSSLITARTSVANARDLVHSRHHYRPHPTPPDVRTLIRRRLRTMGRQMAEFVAALGPAPLATRATVLADDARNLSLAAASTDLVFTSPPYCNALDYTRAHTFSVGWLADVLHVSQADYVRQGQRYIGSERGARSGPPPRPPDVPLVDDLITAVTARDARRGLIVARYFADMWQVLAEVHRILRPGGWLVLVICPSHIRKVEIPTHLAFVEIARALDGSGTGFTCEEIVERTLDDRRRLLPYMREAFGSRMRSEFVVLLRKPSVAPPPRAES